MLNLGVIGLGVRAASVIASMQQQDADVRVTVVSDPDEKSARKRMADVKVDDSHATFIDGVDELLLRSDDLDGLVIGTRCNLHTPMATRIAQTRLPLFLEKPVAINQDQLDQLGDAFVGREKSVVVSFPLRVTPLLQRVAEIIQSGRLGIINQVQAFNYVSYGGVYFGQWYRDFDTTGGLWLQKATHDFDYINRLIAATPTHISAMSSRRVYGGNMPDDLRCSRCDLADTCPEGPRAMADRNDDGGMGRPDHACPFSRSIKHHDAATAMIMYDNGVHASYAQNFITRRSANSRGARITGYEATLDFNWYTETIRVIDHHKKSVDEIKVEIPNGHHGGDSVLGRNFVDVMRGTDESHSPLQDGLLSAAMCLAAQRSEASGRLEAIGAQTMVV